MSELRDALAKLVENKQDAITVYPARLGDGSGRVIAGAGLVYVRVADMVTIATCASVPPIHDLNVWVGYDPIQPNILRVISQRDITGKQEFAPGVSAHAAMHEFMGAGSLGGTDVVKVQLQQFMPLAVWPYQGMQVIIYPGIVWLNNQYKLIADLNQYGKPIPKIIDFGEYPSPDTDKEMYYLVGIDNTGNIQVVAGNQVNLGTISLTDIPGPPENMVYILAAIRRMRDQAAITINRESTDIVDLRFPIRHTHNDYLRSNAILNDLSDVNITSPQDGEVLGYDAFAQTWKNRSGGGDMLKSVYDTDNDGVVDAAESVDWTGVQNKPTVYPPESHNHAASDVNSGVLDVARIPNLDASKITSGTLSTDRYSAYDDLQAEGKVGMVTGRMPTADQVRGHDLWASVVEDWPSTTLPDGWTWAGSPFVTPPSIQIIGSTILVATGYTSASRSYLYRSVPGGTNLFAGFYLQSAATTYVGIRLDDGTDNNYAEAVLRMDASSHIAFVQMRYRTGGGTVNEIAPANMQGNWLLLTRAHINFNILGTQWTSWGFQPNLRTTYGTIYPTNNVSGLTWTPTRAGIVIQSSSFNWEKFGVDWTSF